MHRTDGNDIPLQPSDTPPPPPVQPGTDPAVAQTDKDVRDAAEADIARMEKEYQERVGIGGIRPEAMERLGFSPQTLWDMFSAINDRVEPMDVAALIEGAATQDVPILKDRLSATYRITGGKHDDLISRVTSKMRAESMERVRKMNANPEEVGMDYDEVRTYCELMLACALDKVGARKLPDPVDTGSMADQDKQVQANLIIIQGVKGMTFWLLWINFVWFQYRVRKAISEEVVKNG